MVYSMWCFRFLDVRICFARREYYRTSEKWLDENSGIPCLIFMNSRVLIYQNPEMEEKYQSYILRLDIQSISNTGVHMFAQIQLNDFIYSFQAIKGKSVLL